MLTDVLSWGTQRKAACGWGTAAVPADTGEHHPGLAHRAVGPWEGVTLWDRMPESPGHPSAEREEAFAEIELAVCH